MWFFMTTQFLLFLNVVAFCRHSVLVVYEYLQPGDMPWNRNPKYLYKKKFFPDFIATFATYILTYWYTVA